ncbi:MAG: hypothetical protein KF884_12560 [Fimbriimonadaceae bacterium]|nr:hypothetical protein [Fimbriimonadaceae bacterium]QYK58375.1 MAG: hypothetical protein KF884_12560 [Fimbriimonadaceae bacterium]
MSALLLAASTDPAMYLLERVASAHQALSNFQVEATKTTVGPVSTETERFRILVGSGWVDVDWQGSSVTARWSVQRETVRQLDPKTGQYTESPRGERKVVEALRSEAGGLDSLVFSLIEPSSLAKIFREIDPEGWRIEVNGVETLLKKASGLAKDGIGWNRDSRLLTRYIQKTDKFGVEWRLNLRSGRTSPPPLPPGAHKVGRLAPAVSPPVYDSQLARQVTETLFRRYDRPGRLGYRLAEGEGETRVRIDGSKVWQRDRMAEWTYDGKTLRLHSLAQGWAYDGPATVSEVIDAVARAGSRVDPLLRGLVTGKNPFRTLFGQGAQVSLVGSTSHKGDPAHLIQAKQGAGQATLVIRARDSLVLSSLFTGPDGLAAPTKVYEPDPGPVPALQLSPRLRRLSRQEATGRD